MLRVRLLGTFEISLDDQPVALASRPAQSLFAYLILTAGTSHRREKLAGMLWPDSLEESARDNLRHALWRIRKTLPPEPSNERLLADDLTISFNRSAEYWLDAVELEKVGENASADELMPVLSAYQGELLPGFYDDWVVLEREHLQAVFEHKMARLLALLEGERHWLEVLDWGERWVAFGQKPEPAYRALMSAHAALGEMSKVAATYERSVRSLGEIGIEPSEQTKALYENLKSGREIPKTVPVMATPPMKEVSSSIPVPLTSFIGRERELKDIAKLLSAARLLTMIGPGGVGKTRLAIQTAHDSIKRFKDGVCWVELVGLQDGSLIPQQIAQALDVREVPNQPMIETLKTHLKQKELLLVLDNCEHLIEACAQTVEGLLAACPKLKILATSRERLDLFNETNWNVPSLPLPEVQGSLSARQLREFASIELFVERAGNVNSDFVLTDQNASSVAQICRRLDGIPLAIELAAARIKVLSVEEIESRLNDRFSLLTSGSRTALPRHQTLGATIDWSHELLTEPERVLFRRLAVFVGGFTLEAVEAVCSEGLKRSDILDLLGRLVDKSLVIVEPAAASRETGYRLLETIREYGYQKLREAGEGDMIHDRHLEFFVKLAEEAEPKLFGAEQIMWFQGLEVAHDNLRAAMQWGLKSGAVEMGSRLAAALGYFWWVGGYHTEGYERLSQNLARQVAKRTKIRANLLNTMGFLLWTRNDQSAARPLLEEALAIGRELKDTWNTARSLQYLGRVATSQGEYAEARLLLEEGLVLWRQLGTRGKHGIGWSLTFLGDAALFQDDYERAQVLYQESISLLRELAEKNILSYTLRRLGLVVLRSRDYRTASALCRESLILNTELGHKQGIANCLTGFAAVATARGDMIRAVRLVGAAEALLEAINMPHLPADAIEYDGSIANLRLNMDEGTFVSARTEGRAMALEQAMKLALEET